MFEILELNFKNIGRFIEEQNIDFSLLNQFIQIDGQNNNTGGSSGSGKSTIFNALDYLLGLNDLPSTVLQSRFTKESILVRGIFLYNNEKILITRSKGFLKIESHSISETGKRAEEVLKKVLGIDSDLFRKIIHKRQKEGGFFLNFTPSQMHEFLADCIGLSSFKDKQEKIENKILELENKLSQVNSELVSKSYGLSTLNQSILSLGDPPLCDISKEIVLKLKVKYEHSKSIFNEIQYNNSIKEKEYEKNRPSIQYPTINESKLENLTLNYNETQNDIQNRIQEEKNRQLKSKNLLIEKNKDKINLINKIKDGERAMDEMAQLMSHLKSINSKQCPTCNKSWENEESENKKQQILSELKKIKTIIDESFLALKIKNELEQEILQLEELCSPVQSIFGLDFLNKKLEDISKQIIIEKENIKNSKIHLNKENQKLLDDFILGQSILRKELTQQVELARGQMDVDYKIFESSTQKLNLYESSKKNYESTFLELNKQKEILKDLLNEISFQIKSLSKELALASEIKKAIKLYVSYSFDQALESISSKATEIIRNIPNMANATIQFDSSKETKEGRIKEEVNAVINLDNELAIPIKSLSGGERSAIDLSVDLAVVDYIESKNSIGFNLFILDEPFNGLGTTEIEMALEVLKKSNLNKKLLIVDHNAEIKEMVQDRLIVTRNGQISRIM